MDRGYIKLWRKSMDSEVFASESLWRLWSWCLMKTTYRHRSIPFKTGKGTVSVKLSPGEFIFGRHSAAEELGDNESTIWKRMKKLESIGNIEIKSNSQYSVVSICNWDEYQDEDIDKVTPREHPSDTQVTAKEHPSNTNKKVKKDKKEKNNTVPDFCVDAAQNLRSVVLLRRHQNITPSVITSWANTIRLMVESDKIQIAEINACIEWYRQHWNDSRWIPVVESASALREKWGKLVNAARKESSVTNTAVAADDRVNKILQLVDRL